MPLDSEARLNSAQYTGEVSFVLNEAVLHVVLGLALLFERLPPNIPVTGATEWLRIEGEIGLLALGVAVFAAAYDYLTSR